MPQVQVLMTSRDERKILIGHIVMYVRLYCMYQ